MRQSNYYPFGLKHKGYNNVFNYAIGNSTAQKFKYNGMELENSLGIDWYEMDMRQYDPAIARWTSIDPVTHHSMSTYTAFDNNPVYWADPSGADSRTIAGPNGSSWTVERDENGEWVNPTRVETSEEHVTNDNKGELETVAADLNSIYKSKYGKTPFSVEKQTLTKRVKVKDGGWFGEDEYKEVKYETYVLKGSIGFNWDQDKYTRALYAIMTSKEDIVLDIVPDKGKSNQYTKRKGLLKDYGGGVTHSKNQIYLSDALALTDSKNSILKWTFGGVALHELLYHISPNKDLNEGAKVMRKFYNIRTTGRNHPRGENINRNIKPAN